MKVVRKHVDEAIHFNDWDLQGSVKKVIETLLSWQKLYGENAEIKLEIEYDPYSGCGCCYGSSGTIEGEIRCQRLETDKEAEKRTKAEEKRKVATAKRKATLAAKKAAAQEDLEVKEREELKRLVSKYGEGA